MNSANKHLHEFAAAGHFCRRRSAAKSRAELVHDCGQDRLPIRCSWRAWYSHDKARWNRRCSSNSGRGSLWGRQRSIMVPRWHSHRLRLSQCRTLRHLGPFLCQQHRKPTCCTSPDKPATPRVGNRHIYQRSVACPEAQSGCPAATQLTTAPSNNTRPAWSPDGSSIAFVSNRIGLDQIYVINPSAQESSSNPTTLVSDGTANYEEPAWKPAVR